MTGLEWCLKGLSNSLNVFTSLKIMYTKSGFKKNNSDAFEANISMHNLDSTHFNLLEQERSSKPPSRGIHFIFGYLRNWS